MSYLGFYRSYTQSSTRRRLWIGATRLFHRIGWSATQILAAVWMAALVLMFAPSVNAQSTEKPGEDNNTCNVQIAPIDSQQLAADPAGTKARIIARMLQDMDRCLGLEQSRVISTYAGNTLGVQASSQAGQHAQPSGSSEQTPFSPQATPQDSQASIESSTTSSPKQESSNSVLRDSSRSNTIPPTPTEHKTSILNIGPEELVLDDYAKTLHEAYLVETDPVLKDALGKELSNYINNKKQ